MSKVIGNTVGTTQNPQKLAESVESPYDIAVKHGFKGTEEEWVASLKGEPGGFIWVAKIAYKSTVDHINVLDVYAVEGRKFNVGDLIIFVDGELCKITLTGTYNAYYESLGIKLPRGENGYTPQREVDYWTDADKEEIITEVEKYVDTSVEEKTTVIVNETKKYVDEQLSEIEVTTDTSLPEYVEALSEDLDKSKIYVLPDGYSYAYKEGENVIYNYATDIEINRKLRDGITSNAHGYVTTPFIPITWEDPYVVRVYSDNLYNESVNKALYIEGYDADENMIGSLSFGLNNYSNGVIQVELNESAFIDGAPSLLRICFLIFT